MKINTLKLYEKLSNLDPRLTQLRLTNYEGLFSRVLGRKLNHQTFLNEMLSETKISADSKAYVTMFTACSHGGDVRTARNLWNGIGAKDIKYHSLAVSSFVDCLFRNGYLVEAFDVEENPGNVVVIVEWMQHSGQCVVWPDCSC